MKLMVILFRPVVEFLLGVAFLAVLLVGVAHAQTQSVLPNGMTQFVDGNGAPYAGGKVYMYVPHTTTPKTTYQDPYGKTPNQNPITLDANGRGIVWGNGVYRQVLQNALGVVVWDQLTYASPVGILGNVGTFWYGTASGTANSVILSGVSGFNATDGQEVGFIANATNTGATTINPGGYGAVFVEKNVSGGLATLSGGEIAAGGLFYATYSASANSFVLENPLPTTSKIAGGTEVPGLVCDGVTDNTAALNTAIASVTSGAWFILPSGNCVFAGTVVVGKSGVHISGQGPLATFVNFSGTGTGDGFQLGTAPSTVACVGATPPSTCTQLQGLSVANMSVNALGRTGGYLFDINGAAFVTLENLVFQGWDFLQTQFVNSVVVSNTNGYTYDNAGNSIWLHNSITSGTLNGWYRSDGISFLHFTINALEKGATCLYWDGPTYTVRFNGAALLSCNYGVFVANTATSVSYFPTFLMANDLEIDNACNGALSINAGNDFHISNSFFGTQQCAAGVGKYPLLINPDTGFSVTHGVYIVNSEFHDSGSQAALIGGKNIVISNSYFFDTNKSVGAAVPAIEIFTGAQNVQISNSFAGQRYGDPAAPTYGVVVDVGVGAGPVSLSNMDFAGALTGNVYNLSPSPVGWIYGIKNNATLNAATTCAAATAC